jgi:single-strand DNA-binding protein
MINNVTLIGNTGAPAELKHLNENSKVARISIATTKSYKAENGEWQNVTQWHNVVGWNGIATQFEKITKGEKVYLEGEIQYRSYGKDGEKRYITDIVCTLVRRLNPPADDQKSNRLPINANISDAPIKTADQIRAEKAKADADWEESTKAFNQASKMLEDLPF